MKEVKLTLKEKLAAWSIVKQGGFHEYQCEYTLDTDDLDAVYEQAERNLRSRGMLGRVDVIGTNHEGLHYYRVSDVRNALGETLVEEEEILMFYRTANNKIKVFHKGIDNAHSNARYDVEKGFLKTGLIKKFGLVE